MNFKNRKPTRLKDYDYSQNGYYFITICTHNKEKILCNIVGDDAHIVPTKYGIIAEKYIKNIQGIAPERTEQVKRLKELP